MCLVNTLNDSLTRRLFRTVTTLFSQNKKCVFKDILVDSDCTGVNIVLNESRVTQVYKELKLEVVSLSILKSLRDYNEKLFKRSITHCLLFELNVNNHRKETYLMLIAPIQHDLILSKSWINKYKVLLNMLKNKILFVLDRCEHDKNQTSSSKDLSFLSTLSSLISPSPTLKRPSTPTCEDEGYEIAFELLFFSEQPSKSRRTSSSRVAKKQRTSSPDALNIVEIEAPAFYMLTSNKTNKLFSITSSEIHNSISLSFVRNSRILVNESCSCYSKLKYKKCCESYTTVRVNNTKELTLEDVKKKLSKKYYDFLNVFDRSKVDELPSHRECDHKLKFIDEADKAKLSRSRIYLISNSKLK